MLHWPLYREPRRKQTRYDVSRGKSTRRSRAAKALGKDCREEKRCVKTFPLPNRTNNGDRTCSTSHIFDDAVGLISLKRS